MYGYATSRRGTHSLPALTTRVSAFQEIAGTASFSNLSQLESVIENCLAKNYQFKDHHQVKDFLKDHPFLVNLLLMAEVQVTQRFGADTKIALEVVCDPEDGDTKLFAFILTPLAIQEALALRDRFDEEWWLEASEYGKGQLIFDVEFI